MLRIVWFFLELLNRFHLARQCKRPEDWTCEYSCVLLDLMIRFSNTEWECSQLELPQKLVMAATGKLLHKSRTTWLKARLTSLKRRAVVVAGVGVARVLFLLAQFFRHSPGPWTLFLPISVWKFNTNFSLLLFLLCFAWTTHKLSLSWNQAKFQNCHSPFPVESKAVSTSLTLRFSSGPNALNDKSD